MNVECFGGLVVFVETSEGKTGLPWRGEIRKSCAVKSKSKDWLFI